MPIITTGPTAAGLGSTCTPWATIADLGSPCDDYTIDTSLLEDSLQIASDVLFHLSGQRFPGECEATIRPCGYRTPESCGCLSSRTCACSAVSELHLPGPVVSVDEVKIDGAVLDSATGTGSMTTGCSSTCPSRIQPNGKAGHAAPD